MSKTFRIPTKNTILPWALCLEDGIVRHVIWQFQKRMNPTMIMTNRNRLRVLSLILVYVCVCLAFLLFLQIRGYI